MPQPYAEILTTPARATDAAGAAYANATWTFTESDTTSPLPVYAAPDLASALPNPLVADAGGKFPPAWFDPAKSYRGICKDASGTIVLHDIDPINPALWATLGAGSGADRVGFLQTGTGAATRTVAAKLANAPIDVEDFGAIGTVDDTAVFQAAYDAAAAAGRPLRLPVGWFAVSGLVFHSLITVRGAGTNSTWFYPTADGQSVVTVNNTGAADSDRSAKWSIGDFAIDLSANSNCIGLSTQRLTRTVFERIRVIGDESPSFTGNNTAWRSVGDQYCSAREIGLERCSRGLVLTNHVTAGGGNNNHFDSLMVNACQVNVMLFRSSPYPFGYNQFTNMSLQASGHCSLYLSEVSNCTFTQFTPEGDFATQATRVIEGQTVKRGLIHADNLTNARFDGYSHVSNNALMRITANNKSALVFVNSDGAAINTEVDASSSISWEGRWGNGSTFRNTRISVSAMNQSRSLQAWYPASSQIDPAFPNEGALPVSVPVHQLFSATSRLVSDPQTAFARELTYLAQAGTFNTNAALIRVAATEFNPNDTMWAALLIKADRDTQIGFMFAQSSVSGTIDLKANQWTRLIVSNHNVSGQTRFGSISLWPVAADQPVLRVAQPIGLRNPTAQQTRLMSEEHRFNPNDPAGHVLRMAAAPTTGSWTQGTVILHSAPAAGGVPGWVCTAAGTPGTWKAMAALAA